MNFFNEKVEGFVAGLTDYQRGYLDGVIRQFMQEFDNHDGLWVCLLHDRASMAAKVYTCCAYASETLLIPDDSNNTKLVLGCCHGH